MTVDKRFVKIGYSNDPRSRLANLQVANPIELKLLAMLPGDAATENAWHGAFADFHTGFGEWFFFTPKLRQAIEQVAAPTPSAGPLTTGSREHVWWHTKLLMGELISGSGVWPTEIEREALHDDFVKAIGNAGRKPRGTRTALGMFLSKLLPQARGRRGWRGYWQIPPLAECRQAWDRQMRTTTRWDEDDVELEEAA